MRTESIIRSMDSVPPPHVDTAVAIVNWRRRVVIENVHLPDYLPRHGDDGFG